MTFMKLMSRLRGDKGGNAMMLVAMGAPILFGSTGYAVDTAQWYMWKRELQYAADQAALAGAWSRGNGDTGNEYYTRARQEFTANVSIVNNYTTLDEAELADYVDGDPDTADSDNSVLVTASTTGTLPFASLLIGSSTTVRVSAQATYETTEEYTACLLALDEHAPRSLWFNGGPTVDAACGVGAISDASNAISVSGNGEYNVGWAISGGGVDDGGAFGDADIVENVEDIYDPFKGLAAPDNPTPQTLSCGGQPEHWRSTKTESGTVTYSYAKKDGNSYTAVTNFAGAKPQATNPSVVTANFETSVSPVDSTSATPVYSDYYKVFGSGKDAIYERTATTSSIAYTDVQHVPATNNNAQPGTYADFSPSCHVTMAGGIYVIDGGVLNVNANYHLTGNGIMFVLKNGASISINGGSNINLSPMDKEQLIAAGIAADVADGYVDMLIFEDPNSEGTENSQINGNAQTNLNGIIYLPKSSMTLAGNMHAESTCLMIATKTLKISGSAVLNSFCPAGDYHNKVVADGGTRVRLIA